jgi:ribose transport system ATP-binding protein
MDEPTSALTGRESAALFTIIRRLTARGVSVVYISHRLDEIFEIGDRVTVLRDGRHVATRSIGDTNRRDLVRLMVDRDVHDIVMRTPAARGNELLRVTGLRRAGVLHDVALTVHAGEIVGLAGLLGSGRTRVARAIFGLDRRDGGEITVKGRLREISTPRQAIRAGLGFVTEDRKGEGLVLGLTVRENLSLPVLRTLNRLGVVRRAQEREMSHRYARELRIKVPSIEQTVLHLSGGNQQKVVLGKWLACEVDVLFLDEPTRGIDVGSKQEIYNLMSRLAARGVGIVLISSELPEIVGLCDRVLVMRSGRVAGEFTRDEATQERLLACAVGA